jgi:hypothetical protein
MSKMIDKNEVLIKAHLMCSNEKISKEDIKYIKNALAMALNLTYDSNETSQSDYQAMVSKVLAYNQDRIEMLSRENENLEIELKQAMERKKELKNNNVAKIIREREVLFWILRKQMNEE